MAVGFGLLTLPKMPELKRSKVDFFQPAGVDLNEIAYKDKAREKIRQERLAAYQETGVWPTDKKRKMKKTEAWSEKKAEKARKKEKKLVRTEQKERRKKKKRSADEDQGDWDELAKDARLLKKFKKGKVNERDALYNNKLSFNIDGLIFFL